MSEKPGVFISHIHEDGKLAVALETFVRKTLLGAVTVFNSSNRESIAPGDPWRDLIVQHLRACKVTLILASAESVQRPWINFESGGAWIAGNRVVPVCVPGLAPLELPAPLVHLQAVELSSQESLRDLIRQFANVCDLEEPQNVDYAGATREFRRLADEAREPRHKIANVFTEERGYTFDDALVLLKHAMNEHNVSKWGVAVPLVAGNCDLMVGFRFGDSYLERGPHFLPGYAVDAQRMIHVRILSTRRPRSGVGMFFSELLWGAMKSGPATRDLLSSIVKELLKDGLHPDHSIDLDDVCRRLRRTLTLVDEAHVPGSGYRSDIGAVICLLGDELLLTTDGIKNIRLRDSEAIPMYGVFERAGFALKPDHLALKHDYFAGSEFADHPELAQAIAAVRLLYSTRFLEGLLDAGLETESHTGPYVGIKIRPVRRTSTRTKPRPSGDKSS